MVLSVTAVQCCDGACHWASLVRQDRWDCYSWCSAPSLCHWRGIYFIHNVFLVASMCFYTHTRLTALCPGLPGWAGTRKVKPIWILLKQEIVCGSSISWAICKSAPSSRQITMPAPHHSVFYRPDALPATQPASKHWRLCYHVKYKINSSVLYVILQKISHLSRRLTYALPFSCMVGLDQESDFLFAQSVGLWSCLSRQTASSVTICPSLPCHPSVVYAMNTVDKFNHCQGRIGKYCVTLALLAGLLSWDQSKALELSIRLASVSK